MNFSGRELHTHLAEADPVAGQFSKMFAALDDGEVIRDQRQAVRRPLEDRAAKVMVPFGWYHQ